MHSMRPPTQDATGFLGGRHIAECVDLDILSQGSTPQQAIAALQEAMAGYLEAALDGGSTKGLVLRRSPLTHRLRYRLHSLSSRFRELVGRRHSRHVLPKPVMRHPRKRPSGRATLDSKPFLAVFSRGHIAAARQDGNNRSLKAAENTFHPSHNAARLVAMTAGAAPSSESAARPIPNNVKYHNCTKSSDCKSA